MENNNKIKVLIVEDEIIIALFLKQILEELECDIIGIVCTGKEAVEFAMELRVDIVFLDIILEGEIDGIDTAIQLNNFTNIPIVYTTACLDETTSDRALQTSPFGFIMKPYNRDELRNIIHNVFETLNHALDIN